MKKETKKTNDKNKDREFGVILERIYSEIKVLSEGHGLLNDKMDATMGMVAKSKEDITMLTIRMSRVTDDLLKISGKLAKIEEDIAAIKIDFNKRLSRLEAVV
jgi:hypothetical protein